MAATKRDISEWYDQGLACGATHMIVKVDWFDYEDYPIFVMPGEDVRKKEAASADNTMEVYNFSLTKDEQLNAHRARNY